VNSTSKWQLIEPVKPPQWLIDRTGIYAAQLIWQRGWQTRDRVEAFLNCEAYKPTSSFAFGVEMSQAINRIKQAFDAGEKVAIWGDFDADGITATAVLWEGLGQFFPQDRQLVYYIPDRLTESHGLSRHGIDLISDCKLIVTCDTGSTNATEIAYANSLGIDVIVTDHHALPAQRPPVVAIVNPRYLDSSHPLYNLSGVAVAFKLVEALYEAMPDRRPVEPLENLLDLVAIGLVADLVQLVGDCRYLAQRGIEVLRQKRRPGIQYLLEQCKKAGDRAIDISFGIAPRLNSISRIWGDVRKCVELLTSKDEAVCRELAQLAELANTQRKAIQKRILIQVEQKISQVDLSTTGILVLDDAQWPVGILGLVAGQIASTYNRPTILCNSEDELARGSARSPAGIDLYELIKGQEHLLASFGGHPLAAGLSLPTNNIPLLREALNHRFWQQYHETQNLAVAIDLKLQITDLGQSLFRQIKLLEPYGMGNPAPRFLIQNCHFEDKSNANIKNAKGQKVEYIKSRFTLVDATGEIGGDWWGHYSYELPEGKCDAIVELVDNTYKKSYEVRLIDFIDLGIDLDNPPDRMLNQKAIALGIDKTAAKSVTVIDWRDRGSQPFPTEAIICDICPTSWQDLDRWMTEAAIAQKPLVLTYAPPAESNGIDAWKILVGIAKYLSRTGKAIALKQLQAKLNIDDFTILQFGLDALSACGWKITLQEQILQMQLIDPDPASGEAAIDSATQANAAAQKFITTVNELAFRQQYFDRQLLGLVQTNSSNQT
jgi:single-stranded-DNA-specific exonuclease